MPNQRDPVVFYCAKCGTQLAPSHVHHMGRRFCPDQVACLRRLREAPTR